MKPSLSGGGEVVPGVGGGLEHPVDIALDGPAKAGPRSVQPGKAPLVEEDRVVLSLGPEATNTL